MLISRLVTLLASAAFALGFPPRYRPRHCTSESKCCVEGSDPRDAYAYINEFCSNRTTMIEEFVTLNKTAIANDPCCSPLMEPFYHGNITARGDSIANDSLTSPNNTIPSGNHTMWHEAGEPVPEDFNHYDQQEITILTYSKFNNSCSGHKAQSEHKLKPFKCKNFGEHDRFSEVQFKLPQAVHDMGINCTIDFFNGTGCHLEKLTGRK